MYSPPVDLSFKNISNVSGSITFFLLCLTFLGEYLMFFRIISGIQNILETS